MSSTDNASSPLGIPAEVWAILACPGDDRGAVEPDLATGEVVCTACGRRYPVRDGIPVMLLDEATPAS